MFQLYALENKGYYPPMRCNGKYRITYNKNFDYDGPQTYWMYFLAKYASKAKFGAFTGMTNQEVAYSMQSVLWGCPNFTPIMVAAGDARNTAGGVATVYTGYGMNGFPEYTATFPKVDDAPPLTALGDGLSYGAGDPKANCHSGVAANVPNWGVLTAGKWYKQRAYTSAAERALAGDCRAYVLEALAAPNSAAIAPQADLNSPGTSFWAGPSEGETSYDYYRHGKYPKKRGTTTFDTKGGKIGFNILYADGHVKLSVTREEGIKAARMRWPG